MQIEARIDQNAALSGQLTLWNQQGSHVRRGTLLVIPCGHALLYAEPIYLQAQQSPMPELRLVVLALQDRLAYGPNFETALAALFGGQPSSLTATASSSGSSGQQDIQDRPLLQGSPRQPPQATPLPTALRSSPPPPGILRITKASPHRANSPKPARNSRT